MCEASNESIQRALAVMTSQSLLRAPLSTSTSPLASPHPSVPPLIPLMELPASTLRLMELPASPAPPPPSPLLSSLHSPHSPPVALVLPETVEDASARLMREASEVELGAALIWASCDGSLPAGQPPPSLPPSRRHTHYTYHHCHRRRRRPRRSFRRAHRHRTRHSGTAVAFFLAC